MRLLWKTVSAECLQPKRNELTCRDTTSSADCLETLHALAIRDFPIPPHRAAPPEPPRRSQTPLVALVTSSYLPSTVKRTSPTGCTVSVRAQARCSSHIS